MGASLTLPACWHRDLGEMKRRCSPPAETLGASTGRRDGRRVGGAGRCARMGLFLVLAAQGVSAQEPAAEASGIDEDTVQSWLEAGEALWEAYAPPDVKADYAFPNRAAVEDFLATLQRAMGEGNFDELAAYEPDARRALALVRSFEGGEELADWLEPRLDFLVAAQPAPAPPASRPDAVAPDIVRPPLARPYWDKVVVGRPVPARAGELIPRLKKVFAQQGVPTEWVWIAEVESSLNPKARSPVGARGLFQFMPVTAQRFGLSVSLPDERTDPEKSARAAAQYLRILHDQFGSWPLALAAYNAGEGRVGRALKSSGATSYRAIERHLPAETRLYVPKVLATVARRESLADPTVLPGPAARD